MRTFEISSATGHLGAVAVTVSNIEKHRADFRFFLDKGVILSSVTATVTGASSVTGVTMSDDRKSAIWFLNAASAAENSVLTLTVTTNDGQTLLYNVMYMIG